MTAALASEFPGAVVRSVEVGTVVDGTNSRAPVHLTYRAGTGPERVFVKREGRILNRLALLALRAVASEAELFDSRLALPLEHPRPFAAAVDRRRLAAVVVLEDVTLRSGRPNAATRALSPAEVRSGLAGLARLHARYWNRLRPGELPFLRPWRLGAVWAPVSLASLARALHLLRARGLGSLVAPGVGAVVLEKRFRHWATVAAAGAQTLLHGDPHPGNTYALPGPVTGFYDWQLVRTGNWSHDVGYFVGASLTTADRRDHEETLLRGYLHELRAEGASAPTFDEAWRLYRQTPAFGLGTWLHTLSGGGFQAAEDCVAMIGRFGSAYADSEADQRR